MGFLVSNIICCVDNKICCVDIVAFYCSLKELGVVDYTWFVEVQLLVVCINTPDFELFGLHAQVIFKLTFFSKEVGVVSIVKSESVWCEWSQTLSFNPVNVSELLKNYLKLPRVWDSTLRTLPPLSIKTFWGW